MDQIYLFIDRLESLCCLFDIPFIRTKYQFRPPTIILWPSELGKTVFVEARVDPSGLKFNIRHTLKYRDPYIYHWTSIEGLAESILHEIMELQTDA